MRKSFGTMLALCLWVTAAHAEPQGRSAVSACEEGNKGNGTGRERCERAAKRKDEIDVLREDLIKRRARNEREVDLEQKQEELNRLEDLYHEEEQGMPGAFYRDRPAH